MHHNFSIDVQSVHVEVSGIQKSKFCHISSKLFGINNVSRNLKKNSSWIMDLPIIWVMGGPGSGKSTLSQSIVDKYGYKHLDPSALVDIEIEAKTEIGNEFAEKRNVGQEVPLSDIINLIEGELMGNRGGLNGFVIDGYPQSQNDAEILERRIGFPDLIVALQVGQKTAETRKSAQGLTARSTISFYTKNAAPVLAHYSNKIMRIDGERDAQAIFNDVVPNMDTITKNRGNQITIQR